MLSTRVTRPPLSLHSDTASACLHIKLVVSGGVVIEQGAERKSFSAGTMLMADPRKAYTEIFNRPTHVVTLRIEDRSLKERGIRYRVGDVHAVAMNSNDVRAVAANIINIEAQNGATSAHLRRRQGAHLLELIELLIDNAYELVRERSGTATLSRARRFIAQNLHDANLTPARIASAVHVSEPYLNRLFKAEEALSIMRYVWVQRLELAMDMLQRDLDGSAHIGDIAYMCGFSTYAHFSRAFKKRYGVSPKEATAARRLPDATGSS
jgi:AraC-like DNA-binding protein